MTNQPPHYSPAVKAGNMIFTSGQLPIHNRQSPEVPESIMDQAMLVLSKIEAIMISYGLSKEHIVKTTAYITDLQYWAQVNEAYALYFGDHKPARTIVPVAALNFGCKIEVDAIAVADHL